MHTPLHTRAVRVDYARTQRVSALERVLFRVSADMEPARNSAAFTKRAMLSVLAESIAECAHSGAAPDFTAYAWTPYAPAILTALRRELLCGRSRQQWADSDLLSTVAAIETLSVVLDADVAVRFGQQFAGRQAGERLAELAHDMRSPLNAILLLVERLQHGHNGPVTGAQQRHLALVYSAAFGLSGMASDLMDLARGGSRLLAEEPRAFSLSDVLRKLRDILQPLAEERGVSLRFSGPPADKRVGQVSALHRVLLNLATNALKFTTVGSVTVLVQQETEPDHVTFIVEDTGQGMPATNTIDILGASDNASEPLITTEGLGLAICHKLVSAMQGELRTESRAEHGTRVSFSLRLPVVGQEP